MSIIAEQREEWRRLIEQAEPGNWQRHGSHIYGAEPNRRLICQMHYSGDQVTDGANQDLIVRAKFCVGQLLDALTEAERRAEAAEKLLRDVSELSTGWRAGNEGVHLLRINDIARGYDKA